MNDDTNDSPMSAELDRMLDYAVTPRDLLPTLEHLLSPVDNQGRPKEQAAAMVWGAMGIGKTEIVRSLGEMWNCRIVALHLPQFDPTDLKGIPVRMEDGRVVWVPSSYLPKQQDIRLTSDSADGYHETIELDMPNAEDVAVHILDNGGNTIHRFNDQLAGDLNGLPAKFNVDIVHGNVAVELGTSSDHKDLTGYTIVLIDKAILFLDELSAAVPEVQNAALQLCLDRRVGEYDVPVGVPIVAAGNRESDAAFVHPMSAPLSNRFCHVRLMPSLTDWIEWAMIKKVHPHILGYLQWKGSNSLMKFDPDKMAEGDGGFPTPRSWYKLGQQMGGNIPEAARNSIITGYIGKAMGHDFIAYRKVCELLPSTDDILQGKKVKISDELDHDIGAKYGLATALCYRLEDYYNDHYDEDIKNIEDQSEAWITAAQAFVGFIDKHLGKEMTVLCIHIVSRHLNISFTKFKGTKFVGFATKYRDILRKTV